MKKKMILKIVVDACMTVILLFLMSYALIGETTHEWIGIAMFVLFVGHHVLNHKWSKNILKGKYTVFRSVQTALVVLILLCMAGSMVSGILLSRHVFTFLPVRIGQSFARVLHMICAYWGFIMMSLHLGFHWNIILGMTKNAFPKVSDVSGWFLRVPAIVIAGYGVYAFVKRNIADYLFLKSHFVFFDYGEPLVFFILDYVAVMGLFVLIGHYLAKGLKKI